MSSMSPLTAGAVEPIDDRRLVQLAAERPQPLFSVLSDAGRLKPWVGLIAAFPVLFAMTQASTTTADAWWGLEAMHVAAAETASQWFDPVPRDDSLPFRFQSPLGHWLAAATIRLTDSAGTSLHFAGSTIPAILLIVSLFELASRIGGVALGLMTSVIVSLQFDFLWLAQRNSPHTLGLLLGIAAYLGWQSHLRHATTVISYRLIPAGIALGLCLLASGPMALVLLIILTLHIVVMKLRWREPIALSNSAAIMIARQSSFRSLGALALTAFTIGGW